ncbi:MAG: hypothetical protein ACM3ZE_21840, partial [Myxococcales bacterium]
MGSRHTTPRNAGSSETLFPVAAHPSATVLKVAPGGNVISSRGEDLAVPTSRVTKATRNLTLAGGRKSVR